MSEKRYFKVEYDEEWYLFDSTTISEQLVKEQAEYGYGVFANSLSPSEVVGLLNEQSERIKSLEMELDLIANTKLFSRRKLEEENKQLKKYLKIHNESELSSIEYNLKLYEENRQLMQKNKELFEDLLESQGSYVRLVCFVQKLGLEGDDLARFEEEIGVNDE